MEAVCMFTLMYTWQFEPGDTLQVVNKWYFFLFSIFFFFANYTLKAVYSTGTMRSGLILNLMEANSPESTRLPWSVSFSVLIEGRIKTMCPFLCWIVTLFLSLFTVSFRHSSSFRRRVSFDRGSEKVYWCGEGKRKQVQVRKCCKWKKNFGIFYIVFITWKFILHVDLISARP